jgi:hypothetical protein
MGQEISTSHFSDEDFEQYNTTLKQETGLLKQWFQDHTFSHRSRIGGYELEVWLVDRMYNPAPINEPYLKQLDNDLVSPELSRFNIELNCHPEKMEGKALTRLYDDMIQTWRECVEVAGEFDAGLVMIGILPSVQEHQLVLENMSRMKRYQALNEQVIRQRKGKPLQLNIAGHEHLMTVHQDVMLESATTSFQIHLQVSQEESVRAYNASQIAAAATVAVSGNSPFLFGKNLWDETRIPLFEQAVEIGGFADAAFGPLRRVSFGSGYARQSLFEVFNENLEHFPILLPMRFDTPESDLQHLRLHNGTIWRWNRPLIGFDEDGAPHLRIEHRVVSAGPTLTDNLATSAFFFGLMAYLVGLDEPPEHQIDFPQARDNFYACAKHGLNAHVGWFDGRRGSIKQLLQKHLLPAARQGLEKQGVAEDDIQLYMSIIEERIETGQTGANWQRTYLERHACTMQELTAAYMERMLTEAPVHTWDY